MTMSSYSTGRAWSPPALLLEAAGDDDELILMLIDAFGKDTEARIEQMRGALASSSLQKIRAEAHAIKGSAGQMGAAEVAEACLKLEHVCDPQGAVLIQDQINRVQALFDEIRGEMAAYSDSGRMRPPVAH